MDLKTAELPRVAALEPPRVTRLFAFQETARLALVGLVRGGQVVRGTYEVGRPMCRFRLMPAGTGSNAGQRKQELAGHYFT